MKNLVRLRERRHRDRERTFIIEGFRELTRAVAAGVSIREIYASHELFLGDNEPALIDRIVSGGAELVELSSDAFRKASYRDRPEGLLAVADQLDTAIDPDTWGAEPLLLVVEQIEKPGNLGTMLRTADAAGAASVIVCDPNTDPFNPNVVRASLGTLFTVPVMVTETATAIGVLRDHGVRTVATSPAASTTLWDTDLTGSVAIVVGSEQYGLSDGWLDGADHRALLPMAGSADSLNAAMAAGIALFEAVRQRSANP